MAEDDYKRIFSKNLKHYMEVNGKTQVDIINDLGIKRSVISSWCNGVRLPRMDKVDMLAKYFGIRRSDLIEEHEYEECYYTNQDTLEAAQKIFENKELRLLFDAAQDASPDDLETVHQMLLALKRKERGMDDDWLSG